MFGDKNKAVSASGDAVTDLGVVSPPFVKSQGVDYEEICCSAVVICDCVLRFFFFLILKAERHLQQVRRGPAVGEHGAVTCVR